MRLRIALLDTQPTPWRRVEVVTDATLADLHAVIQAVMGWEDLHLHHFRTWIVKLVSIGAEGEEHSTDIMRIARLDGLADLAGETASP